MKGSARVWVNFKQLRKQLSFPVVLRHYKVEVDDANPQHKGPCPLPQHEGGRASDSFSANLERGVYHCFLCGGSGNVLEFAAAMEGVDEDDGAALRRVALDLQARFCPQGSGTRPKGNPGEREQLVDERSPVPAPPAAQVNAPLDFELKTLEHAHPYLVGRGFELKVLVRFGVGYCSRGLLKGRVAIPIHDGEGRLVGYVGRRADDAADTGENPRYLFPARRERGGAAFEFDRTRLLYNAHRLEGSCDDLIVVRGMPSVWWLHQHGFTRAVSLMGDGCSERQAELIASVTASSSKVWVVCLEGSRGEPCPIVSRLSSLRFVRRIFLPAGKAAGLSREKLTALFAP